MDDDWLYVHRNSIRESILAYNGNRIIVALKPVYTEMVRDMKTGEEIPFKETTSGKYGEGDTFEVLGEKETGYEVLVPGIVEKLKFKTDNEDNKVSKIKRPIRDSERPDLEKMIRDYGYKGDIKYWEADMFF